jgi:tRNA threonylcarbamoyladenosine biosynthesis protein TsaB
MQLALDTSTDIASLVLVQDGQIVAELTWQCRQSHTTQLLPSLNFLLGQVKADMKAIDGLVVARGPGSFNGLRVGLSTAKGLAYSLGIPLVSVSTLEADAYQHAGTGLPICPIYDARHGELATAVYQMKDGRWQQVTPEHLATLEALCAEITAPTLFCGEYVAAVAAELTERLGEKAVIATPAARLRRAGFLAELGLKRLQEGDYDDAATLQPLYLRRPPITQPKQPY